MVLKALRGRRHAPVRIDWFDVFIRHIPHRVASTTARCRSRLRGEAPLLPLLREIWILRNEECSFNQDYHDLLQSVSNRRVTISRSFTAEHGMQRIATRFGTMLDLAAALPGYFVIYNGPECGASAPDHMHFQAGSRVLFPIEKDTARTDGLCVRELRQKCVPLSRDRSMQRFDRTNGSRRSNCSRTSLANEPEPLVNIAVFHEWREWTAYLFPRGKHRPGGLSLGRTDGESGID